MKCGEIWELKSHNGVKKCIDLNAKDGYSYFQSVFIISIYQFCPQGIEIVHYVPNDNVEHEYEDKVDKWSAENMPLGHFLYMYEKVYK